MKSDIKEAVMVYEKARMYAYLSAEITSLYHEAAVKIGISDTVLNILYVLCEKEGQCLQRDIFRLTGISRSNNQFGNPQVRTRWDRLSEAGRRPKHHGLFDQKREQLFHRKNSPVISNRR